MDNDILEGRKGNGSLAEWYLMCSSNRLFFIGRVREDKINPHTDGFSIAGSTIVLCTKPSGSSTRIRRVSF